MSPGLRPGRGRGRARRRIAMDPTGRYRRRAGCRPRPGANPSGVASLVAVPSGCGAGPSASSARVPARGAVSSRAKSGCCRWWRTAAAIPSSRRVWVSPSAETVSAPTTLDSTSTSSPAPARFSAGPELNDDALEELGGVLFPDFADWFAVDVLDTWAIFVELPPRPSDIHRHGPEGHPDGDRSARLAISEQRAQVVMNTDRIGSADIGAQRAPGYDRRTDRGYIDLMRSHPSRCATPLPGPSAS